MHFLMKFGDLLWDFGMFSKAFMSLLAVNMYRKASRVSAHFHISPQGSRNYKKKRPSPEAPPLV